MLQSMAFRPFQFGICMQSNPPDRLQLTVAIVQLLDDWGVSDSDKLEMLALPEKTRSRVVRAMRDGTKSLPDSIETDERIGHLIGINDALRTSNPLNMAAGAMWMRRPNNRFKNRAPVRVMIEDGLIGIKAVRVHLDCSWGWHVDSTIAR